MSVIFQDIFQIGVALGHMILLNTNKKSCMGSAPAPMGESWGVYNPVARIHTPRTAIPTCRCVSLDLVVSVMGFCVALQFAFSIKALFLWLTGSNPSPPPLPQATL